MSEKLPIVHGTIAVQYFAPLRAAAQKAILVPVGVDALVNGKMFVAAIERRSSWL
jgi:hypothetical protein